MVPNASDMLMCWIWPFRVENKISIKSAIELFEPFPKPPGRQRKLILFLFDWGGIQMVEGWIESTFTLVPLRMNSMNRNSAIGLMTIWNASCNELFMITSQTVFFSQSNTSNCSWLDEDLDTVHSLRNRFLKIYNSRELYFHHQHSTHPVNIAITDAPTYQIVF